MKHFSGMWKKDGVRRVITICLLMVSLQLAGCAFLMPQTTALDKIHKTYRADFQKFIQLSVPFPSDKPTALQGGKDQPLFAETLCDIRNYRLQYGEESQEAAHLKVLEGMIYLQSGQTGMARLVVPDVQKAQSRLISKTGSYTRDQLLAMTFPSLVDGWEQTGQQGANMEKLETAADRLGLELGRLDRTKLADPEVDEGAVYIATTAAIFYVWIYSKKSFQCTGLNKEECYDRLKKEYFGKGRDLIGKFLSETEKNAAVAIAGASDVPPGRLRYIHWYGYLLKESSAAK